MKIKHSIKFGIVALVLLMFEITQAQVNVYFGQKDLTYPQKGGIYETAEDLINDKVKDVGVYNQAFSKLKLGFQKAAHAGEINFGDTYYKLKDATFFGYKDDSGNRFRIVNGGEYVVLSAGSKWLYSFVGYRNMTVYDPKVKNKIEKFGGCTDIALWYSTGISSELIRIRKWDNTPSTEANEKLFMDDSEVSQQYMSDVSDDYDPHYKKRCTDNVERIIHYMDVYNQKHPFKR